MVILDNKGWGLGVMLTFLGMFFLAIIMVVYISNKYDIGIKNANISEIEAKNKIEDNNKNIYKEYENIVKEKAVVYQENYYVNIYNGDKYYININKLGIDESIINKCDGYVEFGKKNDIYYYIPYIDCGVYETTGYIKEISE